jgi:hypothetical protein
MLGITILVCIKVSNFKIGFLQKLNSKSMGTVFFFCVNFIIFLFYSAFAGSTFIFVQFVKLFIFIGYKLCTFFSAARIYCKLKIERFILWRPLFKK